MAYVKQTWNPYDENKSEQENIENGAVGTSQRLNHMEEGISSAAAKADENGTGLSTHAANKSNPHGVTKSQVGLGNVDNVKQAPLTDFNNHKDDLNNPHQVTKNQVGLGNVDNVQQASKVNFDNHLSNKDNPHSVTAGQVGAYSKAEADEKYLNKTDASEQLESYYTKTQSDSKFLSKTEAENLYIPRDKLYLTYPIGAPYLSFLPDNPATVLGGGTWERVAKGQTLIGVDENDPDFASAGLTGGQKTQGLRALIGAVNSSPGVIGYKTANSLPGYTGANAYTYAITSKDGGASGGSVVSVNNTTPVLRAADAKDASTLQPFLTIYIWRRTA